MCGCERRLIISCSAGCLLSLMLRPIPGSFAGLRQGRWSGFFFSRLGWLRLARGWLRCRSERRLNNCTALKKHQSYARRCHILTPLEKSANNQSKKEKHASTRASREEPQCKGETRQKAC